MQYFCSLTGRVVTHHIVVDRVSRVSRTLVQRAVLSHRGLPRTVEVVGHDVHVVQDAGKPDNFFAIYNFIVILIDTLQR